MGTIEQRHTVSTHRTRSIEPCEILSVFPVPPQHFPVGEKPLPYLILGNIDYRAADTASYRD